MIYSKDVKHDSEYPKMYLLLLRQVTPVCFFGNTSRQCLELSRRGGIIVSSRKDGCARNGMNTAEVWCGEHSHPQQDREMAAYLFVNNPNASFAFSSISGRLAVGSLNLAQQLSANTSAASHWSHDLRPPVFFPSPVSSKGYG